MNKQTHELYRFEHRGMRGVFNPRNGRWVLGRAAEVVGQQGLTGVLHEATVEALEKIKAPRLFNVKLSDGCNLKCTYCYDDPTSPSRARHMSKDTIDELFRWIGEITSARDSFMFVFHGGEPLLNFDVLEYCVRKYDSPRVEWVLQTNGTLLTPDRVQFLKEYDVRVSLSIDGPKEIHNKHRGSFAATKLAGERLQAAGVRFSAIATVTADTVGRLDEIIEFLAHQGIRNLVVNPALLIGRAQREMSLAERGKADYLRRLWCTALAQFERGILMTIRDLTTVITYLFTNTRDYMCKNAVCGAGNLMVSVNVNGDIYPCDYFTGEAPFRCGNVHEPLTLQLQQPGDRIEQSSECLKCPFFCACYGLEPCPASRHHLAKAGFRANVEDWRTCEIGLFYKDVMFEATVDERATAYIDALLARRYSDRLDTVGL